MDEVRREQLDIVAQLLPAVRADELADTRIVEQDLLAVGAALAGHAGKEVDVLPASSRSNGSFASRSILLTNVKIGIWRIAQTLNSLRVCASTPLLPSMTITAESAAMSVR